MFIRIIFYWVRSSSIFSISTLNVTSAEYSKATENAAFEKINLGKKR